jgi:hypothetical protein
VSISNSGLPLYFSGTTHGSAGKRVVNRGENTAVTASFNSLNFGKRNLGLPYSFVVQSFMKTGGQQPRNKLRG